MLCGLSELPLNHSSNTKGQFIVQETSVVRQKMIVVDRCCGAVGFHSPEPETKHWIRTSSVVSMTTFSNVTSNRENNKVNTVTHRDHGNTPARRNLSCYPIGLREHVCALSIFYLCMRQALQNPSKHTCCLFDFIFCRATFVLTESKWGNMHPAPHMANL